MSKLHQALLAVQRDAPAIHKTKTNPAFRGSKYADLDVVLASILPVLHKHGVVLEQHPSHVDGQPALTTILTHAESGERTEATMLLMMAKADPQGQGSAITYARRYSLTAALALNSEEDDDGAAARPADPQGQRRAPQPAKETKPASDAQVEKIRELATAAGLDLVKIDAALDAQRAKNDGVVPAGWAGAQIGRLSKANESLHGGEAA